MQATIGTSGSVATRIASRTVACQWVPGTDDRVRLSDAHGEAVLTLRQFRGIAGRPAVDALYLSGQTRFDCDPALWRAIETLALAVAPCAAAGREPA